MACYPYHYAVFVYRRPVFLFLCICQLTDCLPPTCLPILKSVCSICLLLTCLPFFLFLCICLPVYRQPVNLCPLTTADLFTVYLSFYSSVSATCLPPTCPPMFIDYRPPVYLPSYSFASANCLPPTCQPMSTDYCQPVYLSSYSFASATAYRRPANLCPLTTCLLPICTPLIFYMPRADLSTIDLCFYSFLSANCLPYYHRSVHICPLTTCLQR